MQSSHRIPVFLCKWDWMLFNIMLQMELSHGMQNRWRIFMWAHLINVKLNTRWYENRLNHGTRQNHGYEAGISMVESNVSDIEIEIKTRKDIR